jgi:hypothetical protein
MLTINQIGHASNFCQIINNCAQTLPTNPNDSITEDAAPMLVSIGHSTSAKKTITLASNNLFFVARFFGLAPFGPHPNQPQIAPTIKTN